MGAPEVPLQESHTHIHTMHRIFSAQQQAFRQHPLPSLSQRTDNLNRLKRVLLDNQTRLAAAIDQDFGGRSHDESRLAEVMPSVQSINYVLRHLGGWMKPCRRQVSVLFRPASNRVHYHPKGVVGVIVPWNYPLYLTVGPLVAALAAGNRVLIKMSEYTPHTATLVHELFAATFPEDLVAVVQGEAEVAAEFSRLPFDHLLFTGATSVGRLVLRAAADNLTPVTLELGGKSPALVARDVPMADAAQRIVFGKALNAGQTCIAPDYVLCPADRVAAFVDQVRRQFAAMYPTLRDNPDYTAIINDRQYQRLTALLDDARAKGADLIELNPGAENLAPGTRKMPLTLILNATDDMQVLQDEIFGPLLPVIGYEQLDDAIAYVNDRPRPLALYFFGYDKAQQRRVTDNTISGGMCINDALMHVAQDDLPFGGVGDSGMGHYHGKEGFLTFSHARAIFAKQRFNSGKFVYPPHGTAMHRLVYKLFIR
ncbi:coniferyl aldehyde dehydrogenase [Marinobacter sp. X15-166B]|uniref:coniferyl aldehyde dehydrogenase n=1 Tax=Marinobacter sp. X15-166B TaxID=1897620 RepID=UPI00085BCED9|nr:coniferyl aldehyde dehydrogenase [Marinobacter sp. X15-166B]OEY65751.1 coniferyl-aldehyde dehydrogenase [Marinobacter sp. X15-166B]